MNRIKTFRLRLATLMMLVLAIFACAGAPAPARADDALMRLAAKNNFSVYPSKSTAKARAIFPWNTAVRLEAFYDGGWAREAYTITIGKTTKTIYGYLKAPEILYTLREFTADKAGFSYNKPNGTKKVKIPKGTKIETLYEDFSGDGWCYGKFQSGSGSDAYWWFNFNDVSNEPFEPIPPEAGAIYRGDSSAAEVKEALDTLMTKAKYKVGAVNPAQSPASASASDRALAFANHVYMKLFTEVKAMDKSYYRADNSGFSDSFSAKPVTLYYQIRRKAPDFSRGI